MQRFVLLCLRLKASDLLIDMKILLSFNNLENCYLFLNLIFVCVLPKQEHHETVRNVGILIYLNTVDLPYAFTS